MPAAILPKPDKKHCKKKSWEASLSDKPSEHVKIDGSAPARDSSAPVIPGPVTLAPVIEKPSPVVQSQAPSGLNAGQLLLQLVTMLRRDDSTLASLKTIVDGMSRPTEPSPTASMQELKAEAVSSPPLAQEPAPAIQFAEVEPAESDKEEKLETPAAIKLQIPSPVVEPILASPPDLAIHANPPAAVESVITPDEHQKVPDSTPAVDEIMIFPQKKSKSHKHKHDKSEKHKSKSKHSHKKSSAAPAEKPTIVVTASDDEDLVKEELWYHVDDPTDGGDESEIPPGESKGKTAAVDVNQRPHVVGKLYEPPSLHATKKLSKSTPPAEPKVNGESDLSAKPVATETPVEKPASSPSAPFEFNPTPPRRVKRRVVLISNDASTQTPTPPRTPPTGPIPEMILHPSPERPTPETPTTAPKPAIAKPAAVQPAVIVSAPVRSVVKPTTVPASPPRPRVQHSGKKLGTPVTKEYAPLSVPDSYTGSDEVYMKTLMNVDAGDDLMIVSNLKEEEAVVMQVISAQSHVVQSHDVQSPIVESPAVQSDVAPETVVAPKEPLPDLVTPPTQDPSPKEIAAEALAAIKDDPAALYNLLAALTSQPPSEKPAKAKKEKKEKKRKDRDGEKHKKAKVVVEEELLGDLLGDEGSVASLPVLNPSP